MPHLTYVSASCDRQHNLHMMIQLRGSHIQRLLGGPALALDNASSFGITTFSMGTSAFGLIHAFAIQSGILSVQVPHKVGKYRY